MGLLLYEESFVEQQPFLVFTVYRKNVTDRQQKMWKNVTKMALKTWKNVTDRLVKFEKNVTIGYRWSIWEVEKC